MEQLQRSRNFYQIAIPRRQTNAQAYLYLHRGSASYRTNGKHRQAGRQI
jgi:hypothetical protein